MIPLLQLDFNPMSVDGQMPSMYDDNPFRYRGEYPDSVTGNYYLRARYYEPDIGRFTQEDIHWNVGNMVFDGEGSVSIEAILQSGNLYAFCNSNPALLILRTVNKPNKIKEKQTYG